MSMGMNPLPLPADTHSLWWRCPHEVCIGSREQPGVRWDRREQLRLGRIECRGLWW